MKYSKAEILDKLEEIFHDIGNDKYLMNSYFRVSKAVPEQMKTYRITNLKLVRLMGISLSLVSALISVLFLISSFILSIIFFYQYKYFNRNKSRKTVVFLSHGTFGNINGKKSDQFFARMPEYLNKNNFKSSLIYTNHEIFNYKKNVKLLRRKNSKIDQNLIPKFLKPLETFEFAKHILSMSIDCYILALTNIIRDPLKFILLIDSSRKFYSRSTYVNFLSFKRLSDYVLSNEIEYIFLTLEGHSYEHYLVSQLTNMNSDLKFILYQHSPIVPDQIGVYSFLRNLDIRVVILTTSKRYKEYLSRISNVPKYLVVGSSKYLAGVELNPDIKKKVLFAPEGTYESTYEFLDLIKFLCKNETSRKLVLRLHPNLKKSMRIKYLIRKLAKYENFKLSSSRLEKDLLISDLVFFRSSAVGIQGLQFGVRPVLYVNPNSIGVNALHLTRAAYKLAKNREDALKIIDNYKDSRFNSYQYACEYYAPMNYPKLLNVIRKSL
jgi:lipoprotein signal peptidase